MVYALRAQSRPSNQRHKISKARPRRLGLWYNILLWRPSFLPLLTSTLKTNYTRMTPFSIGLGAATVLAATITVIVRGVFKFYETRSRVNRLRKLGLVRCLRKTIDILSDSSSQCRHGAGYLATCPTSVPTSLAILLTSLSPSHLGT